MIGGTERQAFLLADGLRRRGWHVEVFSFERRGDYRQLFEKKDIPLHTAGLGPHRSRLGTVPALLIAECRLAWLLWSRKFDVVQAFLPLPNFAASVAGNLARTPIVVTSKRNVGAHQDRIPFLRWTDIISNMLSDRITANAEAIVGDAMVREGCDPGKIEVIPNGMEFAETFPEVATRQEVRTELGLGANHVAICYVASLAPRKAHVDLIAAFEIVASRQPDVRLVLIGEDRGVLRSLEGELKNARLSEHVLLLGQRQDVPRLLAGMDMAVMASHEEGLSNALLEKLAAGLAVIATDVGGNREAMEGLPGCILVPARNVGKLADGLLRIARSDLCNGKDRSLRKKMIRERYSVNRMVDAYERLYLLELDKRGARFSSG